MRDLYNRRKRLADWRETVGYETHYHLVVSDNIRSSKEKKDECRAITYCQ